MSAIEPRYLRQVARFIKLCKPSNTAGTNSQATLCHLACVDGRLRLQCTDSWFAFVSEFPMINGLENWSITLRSREIDCLCTRLRALGSLSQTQTSLTSSFNFGPHGHNHLRIARGHFEMTLAEVPLANSFPAFAIPTNDDAWSNIAREEFRDALQFLSQRPGKEDCRDESQRCTLFSDGQGLAGLAGFGVLRYPGSWPSFEVHLGKHNARRVLAWIKRYERTSDTPPEVLRIAEFTHAGGEYYCVQSPDARHAICIPGANVAFQRSRLDLCQRGTITLKANVKRQHLESVAHLPQKTALSDILHFSLVLL